MKLLPIKNSPQFAMVDDADFEALQARRWYLLKCGYVGEIMQVRKPTAKTGWTTQCLYLHRVIAGAAKGQYVDHADHNRLNNTRANLRLCTQRQNAANMLPQRGRSSKGVGFRKDTGKWRAYIGMRQPNGGKVKHTSLGNFETKSEAMRAYDAALTAAHGAFALTNASLKAHGIES